MRFVSRCRAFAIGSLVAATTFTGSRLLADEGTGTLKFLPSTPTPPPAAEDLPSATALPSPPPLEPMPQEPIAVETVPQPPPLPSTTSPASPPPVFPRLGTSTMTVARPHVEPQVTNQTRHALNFYGGHSARATLNQLPRRAPLQPSAPQPMARQTKPFQTIHREPTVSPYLNLYRNEDDVESAPNYFALVRPQMEQLDSARARQREIQQLNRRLQGLSATIARPRYQAGGVSGTGTAARYLDTAQFYAGWRR